jgi:diguanylate cyclase (GGDEF)-like protein
MQGAAASADARDDWGSTRMLRTLWARFALVGLLATGAYLALPAAAQTVVYACVGVAGFAAILLGLHLHRPARPAPWLLIAGGILLWVLGDLAYTGYELALGEAPFPSYADALYLAGYPAMVAAVLVVVRRSGVRDTAAWQDAGIWVLGVLLLSWEWLLEPHLLAADEPLLARSVAVAFPAGDLLLLLLLLRLVGVRTRGPRVYPALVAALSAYLVSDVAYGVQELAGTYESGSAVDLGWLLAYVGIGAIALHPRMVDLTEPVRHQPRSSGRLRLLTLACAALLAPGLLAVQDLWGDHVDALLIAATAAALFVLVALRGSGLLRDLEVVTAELRGRESELHRRATTDGLTGLANRSVLSDRLEVEVRTGGVFCVALLDLDDFKHVNDTRGHEAGDTLLVQVAERLTAALPPQDLVARLGGDEFAVVSMSSPQQLIDRLLSCLARPVGVGGVELDVAASIGVAASDGARTSGSDLLRDADIAMYVAKTAGRGHAVVHRPEMSADLLSRLETRRSLAEAVELEQFVPWFQPVVDLATHRLVGVEALARWVRPGLPPLPPASWMPAAEETGLVVDVDALVLRAAARQLVTWSDTVPGASRLDLAVNTSGRTLREPDVAQRILTILREEGLDPRRVVVEVTEGVLIDEAVGARLQRLREAGVRIALDDFGTGWSSLTYLRRFPVDVLKLDRSFVATVADGEGGRAVPAAVLQLAAALRLEVVAEGIETPEQAAALRELGCTTAQGYLLGRPAAAAELADPVRQGRVDGGPPVAVLPDIRQA